MCGRPGDRQLASRKTVSARNGTLRSIEPGRHFAHAILPDGLEFFEFRQQSGMVNVEKIAQQMHFPVQLFGG